MKKTLLITRPDYDLTLNALSYWSLLVISIAKKKGFTILDLKTDKASKSIFESYIRKNNPSLIFFNGHGTPKTIMGFNGEILLQEDDNETLMSNKIIYARSCDSARSLGKACVKKGAKAFIGYINKFYLWHTIGSNTKPLKDKITKRFLEPSNLVMTTLVKGHPAGEAHLRSKIAMLRNYRQMSSSNASNDERLVSSFLWLNYCNQKLIGDISATC